MVSLKTKNELRRGWTTGTCATAATRAAIEALWTGSFPDPVCIKLPGGGRPQFALATCERGDGWACAGVVKDAGDDPDVTHGALVKARVSAGSAGSGVAFKAGSGVGVVTKPGLPLPPGEPAINPVPRQMMCDAIAEAVTLFERAGDIEVELSVENGEELARHTLNGRLGIVGGLSILGTTGIVIPYSCAAWIHTIHRGIDVARALELSHIAGATGATSETAIQKLDGLDDSALIDMGDFVGGMLKYLKTHPVARVTIAGGIAKMTKLAQGRLDLHSKRGSVDFQLLAKWLEEASMGADDVVRVRSANSVLEVLQLAAGSGINLGEVVAERALTAASAVVRGSGMGLDVVVFDRQGELLARTPVQVV